MDRKCFILSGVPGSGKSTWAKTNYPDAVVCSADDFFTDLETGTYTFDATKLGDAHNACLRKFLSVIAYFGADALIVDNTNRTVAEIAPYYRVAECSRYEVEVVRFCVDPVVAAHRCVHGVPLDKVIQMANFEALPAHWRVRYVYGG